MKPNLGLSDANRKAIIDTLNTLLATESVLYQKTRNYHWNVTGPQWHSLHLLFEDQYNKMAVEIDEIAERARTLGGNALGTMSEFLSVSKIDEEKPGVYPNAHEMVARLVEGHEAVVRYLRESIDVVEEHGDPATADQLTGLVEDHEKAAWFLRTYIEGSSV